MTNVPITVSLSEQSKNEMAPENEVWIAKGFTTATLVAELKEREVTNDQFRELLDWLATYC